MIKTTRMIITTTIMTLVSRAMDGPIGSGVDVGVGVGEGEIGCVGDGVGDCVGNGIVLGEGVGEAVCLAVGPGVAVGADDGVGVGVAAGVLFDIVMFVTPARPCPWKSNPSGPTIIRRVIVPLPGSAVPLAFS